MNHEKTTNWIAKNSLKGVLSSAFTLVELLVVIGIIAILAALLLSALASSKMQARQASCLNNIKQVTLSGLMYMGDTGQGVPQNNPGFLTYDPNAPVYWCDALTNYGAVGNVLFCPSTIYPQSFPPELLVAGTANLPWVTWNFSESQPVSGSFGFNGFLEELITPYPFLPSSKLALVFPKPSSVQKPSVTPLFFDEICLDTFPLETDSAATNLYVGESSAFPIGGGRGMACCTILRHGGRTVSSSVPYKSGPLPGAINMGFDDGHAELLKLTNLWNCTWHLNWGAVKITNGPHF